jgi:cysteinyl-tRNA synthetase
MSPYSNPLAMLLGDAVGQAALDDLQTKIQSMVNERLAAKLSRDFDTADAIRDELMDAYNVVVRDDLRMWSIGGVFIPPPEPYTMSSYSPPPPEGIDAGRVAALIEERDAARLQRDFRTADDIKVGLQEDYNIVINDRLKQWSVGGNFGPNQEENTTTSTSRGSIYARNGGGSVTPENQAAIEQLLNERAAHQLNKDYGKADRVRERLETEFNVRVDDRNREWHVVTNDFAYKASAHSLDEDTLAYIQEQVNQREIARLQKDYEAADNIRDALMDQFAVSLDDRVKEWTVIVDSGDRVATMSHDMDRASEAEFGGKEDVNGDEEVDHERVPLEEMTVVQLKEMLREKGLPVSGKKADLIERLQ